MPVAGRTRPPGAHVGQAGTHVGQCSTPPEPSPRADPEPRTVPGRRPRARELGIPFAGDPGPVNAVTDVPGVEVGLETIVSGQPGGPGPVARTGVTVVCPLGRDRVGATVPAGWCSLNGNGEMTGTTWIDEAGGIALPIGITSTHAVGPVHRGIIDWVATHHPAVAAQWLLPVVAETWDGYLNDTLGAHVTPGAAVRALDAARSGPVAEGSVGGGTGMSCYGFKAGTGTSSRRVALGGATYTLGVLMQCNFGSRRELVVAGVPVGAALAADNPMERGDGSAAPGAGSCITVVATDAPLLPGQCKALARRVPLGLARTGTTGSHFSGDIFVAFSTANAGALDSRMAEADVGTRSLAFLPPGAVDGLHTAVVEAVEEATVNALVAADDMTGRDGQRSPGLPVGPLLELLGARGVTGGAP